MSTSAFGVSKSKDDEKAGLATAAGAATGIGAYTSGYAGKKVIQRQQKNRKKTLQSSPEGRKIYRLEGDILREHNNKTRIDGPGKSTKFFREYPKSLPGSKLQRLMGHTHKGKKGTAVSIAAAGAGAAGGYAAHEKIKKGAPSVADLEASLKNATSPKKQKKLKSQIAYLKQNSQSDIDNAKAANKAKTNSTKAVPKPKVAPVVQSIPNPTPLLKRKSVLLPAGLIAGAGGAGYAANRINKGEINTDKIIDDVTRAASKISDSDIDRVGTRAGKAIRAETDKAATSFVDEAGKAAAKKVGQYKGKLAIAGGVGAAGAGAYAYQKRRHEDKQHKQLIRAVRKPRIKRKSKVAKRLAMKSIPVTGIKQGKFTNAKSVPNASSTQSRYDNAAKAADKKISDKWAQGQEIKRSLTGTYNKNKINAFSNK